MSKEIDTKKLIKKWYLESQRQWSCWDFGNGILYDMCKKNPNLKQVDQIIGKFMLIGRSYAASLERNKKRYKNYDIYFLAANEIKNKRNNQNQNLDTKLKSLKKIKDNNKQIKEMIETVHFLNDCLKSKKVAGNNKLSLSSKVLHFHHNKIPIFDSITNKSLYKLVSREQLKEDEFLFDLVKNYGKYGNHVARFEYLKKLIINTGFKKVNARKVDTFLLFLSRESKI